MPDYNEELREQILERSEVRYSSRKAELIEIYKDRYGEASVRGGNTPAWRQELNRDLRAYFPDEKNIHRNFQGKREHIEAGRSLGPKLEEFAQEQARKHEEERSGSHSFGKASNPYIASVAPPAGGYRVTFSGTISISGYPGLERDFDSDEFTQEQQDELNEQLAQDPGNMEAVFEVYMQHAERAEYESGEFTVY